MSLRNKVAMFASAVALLGATPALAEPITLDSSNIGESFSIDYDGFTGDQGTIGSLSAEAIFTLIAVDSDTFTFDYTLTNTSDVTSKVSNFSLNTNPDIIDASSTGDFSFTILDSTNPNGIGTVDACFKANRSGSCAGNKGGLDSGQTGSGTLTLDFNGPIGSIDLTDFFVRYQGIKGIDGVTSASGTGTPTSTTSGGTTTTSGGTTTTTSGGTTTTSGGTTTTTSGGTTTTTSGGTSGTPVSEPGMLGLLGASLIGMGFARSRRRRSLKA